ncbi:hydrogenase maturation protease [Sulfurimonas aquatica]|uniref:Hydrogenase maturation protease n=1 Tax=Sulfurimonas aquatica TaxID=2672570 RepID=A0A975GCM4_9BACT|nr:hydrogenase maturation protease [Sulfurimonas aquatica]QSZ41765.1 hydrogenase maturation protease [Sulfurimonas aquatica]
MNKKQIAILSVGNILHKDEGIALYASKYLESNYSFHPSVDIIHGGVEGMSLLNIFMEYEEIIVLDVIGMEDSPGAIYQFPMDTFRGFSTDEDDNETSVLGCLNLIEHQGNALPKVSLLAIIPETIEPKIGLSDALIKTFEAYVAMLVKSLEDKGFTSDEKAEKQTIESIIASFTN